MRKYRLNSFFSLRIAAPFARVRATVDRLYVNSVKSKLLSIMSFRGFRVWYYDLNFIFCRMLRRFAVDGSQVTHKRNNDCMAEFQIRCSTFALFCATRFCRDVFKSLVFFRSGGAPIVATRRLQ